MHPRTLGIGLALLAACNGTAERTDVQATPDGGAPWLMWGTTEELQLTTESAAIAGGVVSHQLANVDYHHPTTWCVFLAASSLYAPPAVPMGIEVRFYVRFGVGRAILDLPPITMNWSDAELQPDGVGDLKVASCFEFAAINGTAVEPNLVRALPAQNIQISADLRSLVPMGPGTDIRAQVTSFAAPLVHVRPDWFVGNLGQELNGR